MELPPSPDSNHEYFAGPRIEYPNGYPPYMLEHDPGYPDRLAAGVHSSAAILVRELLWREMIANPELWSGKPVGGLEMLVERHLPKIKGDDDPTPLGVETLHVLILDRPTLKEVMRTEQAILPEVVECDKWTAAALVGGRVLDTRDPKLLKEYVSASGLFLRYIANPEGISFSTFDRPPGYGVELHRYLQGAIMALAFVRETSALEQDGEAGPASPKTMDSAPYIGEIKHKFTIAMRPDLFLSGGEPLDFLMEYYRAMQAGYNNTKLIIADLRRRGLAPTSGIESHEELLQQYAEALTRVLGLLPNRPTDQ